VARVSFFLIELRPAEHIFFGKWPFDQFEFETPDLLHNQTENIYCDHTKVDPCIRIQKKELTALQQLPFERKILLYFNYLG
jgi:hypothetical protein